MNASDARAMRCDFDKPYPDLCFLGELVFRPSLTSLQGQGAQVVSNFIPFEGMEFDATVSLLPCWGWRGAKSTRLVMGFSLAFEIFWQIPAGNIDAIAIAI